MVSNLAYKKGSIDNSDKSQLKWCSILLSDIVSKQKRLDASVYDIETKYSKEVVQNYKYGTELLFELIKKAYYPSRFKRIYCNKKNGQPFFLPAQICDVYPKPEKYLSNNTKCDFDELKVNNGDILLTRSGTVGNISIVSKTLENKIFSDDVIRITLKEDHDIGFLYAYLKTDIGNKILETNSYGSVVTHIEPEHLKEIIVPKFSIELRKKINTTIKESFKLRDEANELIDRATNLLIRELHMEEYEIKDSKLNIFNVKLSDLDSRLDASYHIPAVDQLINHMKKYSRDLITLGEKQICNSIILPGRFKRIYSEKYNGLQLLGGKDIFQLNPNSKKYISKQKHKNQINKELNIRPNSIIMPARGTLGKVMISPPHFYNKVISDNLMQIIINPKYVGYIYIFLNTEYGETLIKRFTYGGVVDAIEEEHIKNIQIPLLNKLSVQELINNLALEANEKRYQAYKLEQLAIELVELEINENTKMIV